MNKEEIREKMKKLKQEILAEPTNLKKLNEYMHLSSLERVPDVLKKDVQLFDDFICIGVQAFGFINEKGKRTFIRFVSTGCTGAYTCFRVYIINEDLKVIGQIELTTSRYEKYRSLHEVFGETKQYVDIVNDITKKYKRINRKWVKINE